MAGFGEQKKKKKSTPQDITQTTGEVLLKTAIDHHMRGDLVSAEKAYRAAIKTGYMHPTLFSNLGVICKNSERTEQAISHYRKAIEVSPSDPNAYNNIGNLYLTLGQFDQALAAILKAVELKPDSPDVLTTQGWAYKQLGHLDQALEATFKALELNPDNPKALGNLLNMYKGGDLQNLENFARKALDKNKDNLNDLNYIEAISSLGEKFTKDILLASRLSN